MPNVTLINHEREFAMAILWDEALIISETLEHAAWPEDITAALRLGGKLRRLQQFLPTKAALFDQAFLQGLGQTRRQLESVLWLARVVRHKPYIIGDHLAEDTKINSVWELCARLEGSRQDPKAANVISLFPKSPPRKRIAAKRA